MSIRSSIVGSGLFAGLFVLALSTNPAAAQRSSGDAEAACTSDAMALCSEFIPDRGRVAACMARKRTQLSPGCRVFFSKGKARGGQKRKVRRRRG